MSIKERILAIRLLQTIQNHPEYAKMLGVEGVVKEVRSKAR